VKEGEVIAKVKVIPEMGSLSSAQSRLRIAELNLEQAQTCLHRPCRPLSHPDCP